MTLFFSNNAFEHAQVLQEASLVFDDVCVLNSFTTAADYNWIMALGVTAKSSAESNNINDLSNFFLANAGKFIFGHIAYDLKNSIEKLETRHHDRIGFPRFNFFVPEIVIHSNDDKITVNAYGSISQQGEKFIEGLRVAKGKKQPSSHRRKIAHHVDLKTHTDKKNYLLNCSKIMEHIRQGDVYELNYCIELFDDSATIDPAGIYNKLTGLTQAPMSCFYKTGNKYLLCASPERFIKKEGNRIIAQPMKGTIRKSGTGVKAHDDKLKNELYNNEKERAENVMITDLVRNDLSRIAKIGSVAVDELFGIYSFKTAHQMVSTVSCQMRDGIDFPAIIKALFPMGSMTGAPKIRAMQLIDKYENAARGLFSGSAGYISPAGDFDFNVVIRSIFYNASHHHLSAWAGSAITANSIPQKEYEECLLKLQALKQALE